MARSKGTERKIEDEKLEYKARKLLTAEKKAQKERGRVIPDYTTFDYEKRLRKVATRGGKFWGLSYSVIIERSGRRCDKSYRKVYITVTHLNVCMFMYVFSG